MEPGGHRCSRWVPPTDGRQYWGDRKRGYIHRLPVRYATGEGGQLVCNAGCILWDGFVIRDTSRVAMLFVFFDQRDF